MHCKHLHKKWIAPNTVLLMLIYVNDVVVILHEMAYHFSRFNIKGWDFPTIAALYVLLKRCLYVVIFPNPDQSIFLMLWDALLPLIYNEIFSVDLITQTFIYFLFLCIHLRTKNRGIISFMKTYILTFSCTINM